MLKIFDNIYKFENQYFFGEEVGTYLIEFDSKLVFFDLPTYSQLLKNELHKFSSNREMVAILSHGSCGISDGTKWQNELSVKVYLHKKDENHEWLRMKPDILFEEIPTIHPDLEIIWTPGHSEGSICLLHKPSKTLFTGDSIYSKDGNSLTLDSNREFRLNGLKILMEYDFENILPFHYSEIMGEAKVKLREFYIN